MEKSSFLFVSLLGSLGIVLSSFLPTLHAASPPASSVVEVRQNSAGEETITHGVLLDGYPDIVVTVAASVEEKTTFTVGAYPATREATRAPASATVALFDPGSRVLFLKTATAPAGVAPVKFSTTPAAITTPLSWLPAEEPQPAMDAGPVRQLDGRPLALTLRRLHFGSSRVSDTPVPGTPVFTENGELAALPLSPLPGETGAWLSLPATAVTKLAADFAAVGRAETGQLELGIAIGTTTPRIEFVTPGSRAQKAGLAQGDILLALNGRPIHDVFDVLDANFFLTAREPITIRLLRGLETLSVTARPVSPPSQ